MWHITYLSPGVSQTAPGNFLHSDLGGVTRASVWIPYSGAPQAAPHSSLIKYKTNQNFGLV
jgi:hypothetical protein